MADKVMITLYADGQLIVGVMVERETVQAAVTALQILGEPIAK